MSEIDPNTGVIQTPCANNEGDNHPSDGASTRGRNWWRRRDTCTNTNYVSTQNDFKGKTPEIVCVLGLCSENVTKKVNCETILWETKHEHHARVQIRQIRDLNHKYCGCKCGQTVHKEP